MTQVHVNQEKLVELYERMNSRSVPQDKGEAYGVLINFLFELNHVFNFELTVPSSVLESLNLLGDQE